MAGYRIPHLTSVLSTSKRKEMSFLEWSRFRNDRSMVIPNKEDIPALNQHLTTLHLDIKWTLSACKEAEYLDIKSKLLDDDSIQTDVFSKHNCHGYLPSTSCLNQSVLKGFAISMDTRLGILFTDD